MRLLRNIFLHNVHLKLIALAISFFLWATYTAEPFEQVGYNVPVSYLNVPDGLAVGGSPPNTVRVVLRGRSALLRRVMPGDLTVGVDLSTAPSGDVPVHLFPGMVDAPFGTEVIRLAPTQFRIALVPTKIPPEASE
jgi:YbbR domain-containing protein